MASLRISLRSLFILVAVSALLLALVFEVRRQTENMIVNPYRLQSTGDLLVEFLETEGHWPKDWKSLNQFMETYHPDSEGKKAYLNELEANVIVDFSFDPDSVDVSSEWSNEHPQLKVVFAKNGTTHGATRSPNETIYHCLERMRKSK